MKSNLTAIEWLQSIEMERDLNLGDWRQAKVMEKQQIIDAWIVEDNELQRMSAEQYYKETYEN